MTKPRVLGARIALGLCCSGLALAQTLPGSPAGPARDSPGLTLAKKILASGDHDSDRQLTWAELMSAVDGWFELVDADGIGAVRRDEFVGKFHGMLLPPGGTHSAARRFAAASTASDFFSVVDRDRDASLKRDELKEVFDPWFRAWNTDGDPTLDEDELAKGLDAALPRTNLSGVAGRTSQEPIPGLPVSPPAPVLSPEQSRAAVRIVDGFKLELVASEPMIEDPVALSFDEDGRAYVVEMRSYMTDINRTDERDPISRISRLEDTDGDGRFDRSTIFIDGLILPRAVAATAGGILYVSDYMLYFAQDVDGDGKADRNVLLDAEYGRGNVEHAPNGLFRAMDNWIYNGESPFRYRLVGRTLIKQLTEVRGQWGMTQDNFGRLHYNVNHSQLLGDFAPPNMMGRNPHHPSSAGLNLFVATDQRVFPIRMTTAINRGYSPEVLNSEGKAFVFASSCSPVIYRGDNYPEEFVGNAFVLDPALNLIKRNLVFEEGLSLASKFAYEDREFLASTDERFRPCNLYNAPDGTLWFVDLYRGIAQYGQFMTEYLRRETLSRGLEQGIHFGRIYRIASTTREPAAVPRLSGETSAELVARLSHPNGWVRDTAQRLLVERGDRSVASALVDVVKGAGDPLGRIHALWTLEGLFSSLESGTESNSARNPAALQLLPVDPRFRLDAPAMGRDVLDACLAAIRDPNAKIQVAAIRVADALTARKASEQGELLQALEQLDVGTANETLFHAALSAGNLPKPDALPLLARIGSSAAEHRLIREAVISGLANWELQFAQLLMADPQWLEQKPGRAALLDGLASAIMQERDATKIGQLLSLAADQPPEQAWRRNSLLEGILANVSRQPPVLIALSAEPAAVQKMSDSPDPRVRDQMERIKFLFAWPGHQFEKVTTPPRTARPLTESEQASITTGKELFQQLCASCHGLAGQGIVPMAPPLVNSDWVLGSEHRLIRIVLQGVKGPINVNGSVYAPPHILPEMPGLATLEDAQIAAVLSYLRRAWDHGADPITAASVAAVRQETLTQKTPWTEPELLQIK